MNTVLTEGNHQLVEPFLLLPEQREKLWRSLGESIEQYIMQIRELPVASEPAVNTVRALIGRVDFTHPLAPEEAIRRVIDALMSTQVHTPHPRYFGLFNPTPTTIAIAADAIAAAFNPQLCAWRHNPFAVEIERLLIRELASRFGYQPSSVSGLMTSGGSEANHTAVVAALVHAFPQFDRDGLRVLPAQPVLYVSAESHHSFHKATRLCGLGEAALREIPVDNDLRIDTCALESAIREDRRSGFVPFLVVGTAGTTNAGVIDPLGDLGEIAAREALWFHVDAAWGGAAALVPELRPLLQGIESADSITLDAHKWLSVPVGAGIFLTRHPEILRRTFHISAAYIPGQADGIEVADPYESSMHWSRRFIGLKLFLSLAVAGWHGYARILRHMCEVGFELGGELRAADWEVVNISALPIRCFQDPTSAQGRSAGYLEAIAHEVIASGHAWISTTRLGDRIPVLRACITSYRTNIDDIRILIRALNFAREKLRTSGILTGNH